MPAIQELMPAQNFGGELGKILGGGISQGLNQQLQSFEKQKQNKSQIQSLMPLLEKFDIKFSPEEQKVLSEGGFEPEMFLTAAMGLHKTRQAQTAADQKTAIKEKESAEKLQREQLEKQQTDEANIADFQRLDELVDYSGVSPAPGHARSSAGAREGREELRELGFLVADRVFTHFNKGTLTDRKFKEVKNNLAPHPNLPPWINRARIKALARIARLPPDIKREELNKEINREINNTRKVKEDKRKSLEDIFE